MATRSPLRTSTFIAVLALLFWPAPSAQAYRSYAFTITASAEPAEKVEFSGWCDIGISNSTLLRIDLESSPGGMDPVEIRGRTIDNCKLSVDSGEGDITLSLKKNGKEFYRKTSSSHEDGIFFDSGSGRHRKRPMTIR